MNKETKFLPYAVPDIGDEEIKSVIESLESGWLTTGPKVKQFESDFSKYIKTENSIAVNSCTAALHLSLAAMNVGPGDEVLLPSLTFCSTANVIVHQGAKPVFVDIDKDFNISLDDLVKKISNKTKAIIPVHYGGKSCRLYDIYNIAMKHRLYIIEDAAHAVGTLYNGYRIGSDELQKDFPDLIRTTCFSFYATKNMTTGEGGMVTISNPEIAQKIRILSLHGMSKDAWKRYSKTGSWYYEIQYAGYKYNMTDIQAALGIYQLQKLDLFNERRRVIAKVYNERFLNTEVLIIPWGEVSADNTYHLYPLRIDLDKFSISRAEFIQKMTDSNIGTSVHFIPVHIHPYYREKYGLQYGDLPATEAFYESEISVPDYPKMTEKDIMRVIDIILDICKKYMK